MHTGIQATRSRARTAGIPTLVYHLPVGGTGGPEIDVERPDTPSDPERSTGAMVKRMLAGSRYLVLIAVLGTFLGSATLLIYGGWMALHITWEALGGRFGGEGMRELSFSFIEVIDLFLLGTVFYIVSLGLYLLFIDDDLPVPSWLKIHELDDLKAKLIGVVIVMLAVTFLGEAVSWKGDQNILALGAAVGLVLVALASLQGISVRIAHGSSARKE